MSQPPMSEDQRIVAVGLLANALRKEARLRREAEAAEQGGSLLAVSAARARHTAAEQYLRGMVDLLSVLFDGGRRLADHTLEKARIVERGPRSSTEA
jgi:hypothetical protein